MNAQPAIQKGLVALGAQQVDIRPRFVNYAADHFGMMARGEKPPKPETFTAEITATILAELVGAEVPLPIQAAEKRTHYNTKKNAETDADADAVPSGPIEVIPEAEPWLRSHSPKKVFKPTLRVLSAFMMNPRYWWRAVDLAKKLDVRRPNVTRTLKMLREMGLLISEGTTVACRWKLAEMPPRV